MLTLEGQLLDGFLMALYNRHIASALLVEVLDLGQIVVYVLVVGGLGVDYWLLQTGIEGSYPVLEFFHLGPIVSILLGLLVQFLVVVLDSLLHFVHVDHQLVILVDGELVVLQLLAHHLQLVVFLLGLPVQLLDFSLGHF